MLKILENLVHLIRDRKKTPINDSYTTQLLEEPDLAKKKIIEEINELIEAAEKNSNKTHEAADVFYNLLVVLYPPIN